MWARLKRFPQLLESDDGLTPEQEFAIRANELVDDGFTYCESHEGMVAAAPWCSECGARIEAVRQPRSVRACGRCRSVVQGRFCGSCGLELGDDVAEKIRTGEVDPGELMEKLHTNLLKTWRR